MRLAWMVPDPVPLVVRVSVYGPFNVNCASTASFPSTVRSWGLVVPVRLPVNAVNVEPVEAFAQTRTMSP